MRKYLGLLALVFIFGHFSVAETGYGSYRRHQKRRTKERDYDRKQNGPLAYEAEALAQQVYIEPENREQATAQFHEKLARFLSSYDLEPFNHKLNELIEKLIQAAKAEIDLSNQLNERTQQFPHESYDSWLESYNNFLRTEWSREDMGELITFLKQNDSLQGRARQWLNLYDQYKSTWNLTRFARKNIIKLMDETSSDMTFDFLDNEENLRPMVGVFEKDNLSIISDTDPVETNYDLKFLERISRRYCYRYLWEIFKTQIGPDYLPFIVFKQHRAKRNRFKNSAVKAKVEGFENIGLEMMQQMEDDISEYDGEALGRSGLEPFIEIQSRLMGD